MEYRDTRQRTQFATMFTIGSQRRPGTIVDVSRSGVLAEIEPPIQRGETVHFTIGGTTRAATIVRVAGRRKVGLRLTHALRQDEFRKMLSQPARDGRRSARRFTEL